MITAGISNPPSGRVLRKLTTVEHLQTGTLPAKDELNLAVGEIDQLAGLAMTAETFGLARRTARQRLGDSTPSHWHQTTTTRRLRIVFVRFAD